MLDVVRKLLSFLDRRARVQLVLLVFPLLLSAALEMASIGMILPLVQVAMGAGESKALIWLSRFTAGIDKDHLVLVVALAFAAFFVVKNAAILATIYAVTRFTHRKMALFLQRMFDLYLHRPYTFHLQRNSAEVIRNLSSSVGSAFDGLRLGINLILDAALAGAAFLLLLLVEPKITIGIAVVLIGAGAGLYLAVGTLLQRWGARVHHLESKMIQSINQGLGAIKDIKILNCQSFMNAIFREQTDTFSLNLTRSVVANQSPRLFVEVLIVAGFLVVVLVLMETRQSTEDVLATLGLFGMAALRLMPSMNRIISGAAEIKHRTALVDSLYDDYHAGLANKEILAADAGPGILPFEKEIRLEGVAFSYPAADAAAIKDISLTIPKGCSIGLVGPSGAGKSTLADILMGLLCPTEGRLLVDGTDAFTALPAWQRNIGFVPQHIYFMDDTLRRNIAFGIADSKIDETQLARAIRMAHLDKFVDELPQGLDTPISEHGVRLSGGQRQRVGIARALYRDPAVLVFDEATSALDSETEHEIARAINGLAGKKTIVIIAHRMSTVRNSEKVLFLQDGRLSAVGTFDELSAANEDFRRLVQLGGLSAEAAG